VLFRSKSWGGDRDHCQQTQISPDCAPNHRRAPAIEVFHESATPFPRASVRAVETWPHHHERKFAPPHDRKSRPPLADLARRRPPNLSRFWVHPVAQQNQV